MASFKCKYADVKEIFDWYEKYADDKAKELYGKQPSYHKIAWYAPSSANWAYQIGIVEYEGETYEGVFIFGECRAVRLCQIPKYTREELERR